jgi:hypothetical protein
MDCCTEAARTELRQTAAQRRWGPAFVAVGAWHLLAFGACYYLTVGVDYHDSAGYLAIWVAELLGVGVLFRAFGGPRPATCAVGQLEVLVRRVWIAYFFLAFNLGSLNTLRGHPRFEFFPAIASLASFAFLMMTFLVDRRFFAAVLVMFASGLLMAAQPLHAYLVFALAWWVVLTALGSYLWRTDREAPRSIGPRRSTCEAALPLGAAHVAPSRGIS